MATERGRRCAASSFVAIDYRRGRSLPRPRFGQAKIGIFFGASLLLRTWAVVVSVPELNYEPSLMLALDENCRLQCRLSIETRTNAYQVRTGQFQESPISVYFTVRQYWGRQPYKTFGESYQNQRKVCQELVDAHIIPAVVRPLAQAIAAKQ